MDYRGNEDAGDLSMMGAADASEIDKQAAPQDKQYTTAKDVLVGLEDATTNVNEAVDLIEDGDYAQAIFELEIARDSIDSRIEELKAMEWRTP